MRAKDRILGHTVLGPEKGLEVHEIGWSGMTRELREKPGEWVQEPKRGERYKVKE